MSHLARCRVCDIEVVPGIEQKIVRDIDYVEVLRGYYLFTGVDSPCLYKRFHVNPMP